MKFWQRIINKEILVFAASIIFGATIFPYIFGFFYLLAVGRLNDYFGLFVDWAGFYQDLARGEPYMWGVVFLPYILVQSGRLIARWVFKIE